MKIYKWYDISEVIYKHNFFRKQLLEGYFLFPITVI